MYITEYLKSDGIYVAVAATVRKQCEKLTDLLSLQVPDF